MISKIRAGTSGWAYASWKPAFYPQDVSSKGFLGYYATRLNTVEVNYTFRQAPAATLLRSWIEATPSGFLFAIKAHQEITHFKRLRAARQATSKFIASLEPLREARKLGPILFQLPPNLKCDLALLEDFLTGLPRQTLMAFEFRHESWFRDDVYEALRRANVALCLAESERLRTPDVETADFFYLRLRMEDYSSKARAELAKKTSRLARRGDVFAYFKHEDDPAGALYAEELLQATGSK